jgi:hypothetical protein
VWRQVDVILKVKFDIRKTICFAFALGQELRSTYPKDSRWTPVNCWIAT